MTLTRHAIARLRQRFVEFRSSAPVSYLRAKLKEAVASGTLKHSAPKNDEMIETWEVFLFGVKTNIVLAKRDKNVTVVTVSPVTHHGEVLYSANRAERSLKRAEKAWNSRLKNRPKT